MPGSFDDRARRIADFDSVARGRLVSTLEKLDRIIIGRRNLEVKWDDKPGVIAFNADGNIFLGSRHFKNVQDIDTVVAILGANYHELAHLLFSPTFNSGFMQLVRGGLGNPDLFRAFNYLEDSRIEALFVARYETAKKYFVSTFLDVMIKSPDHDNMFLISHGRRFVPLDVRLELESMFKAAHYVTDEDMEEFKRIIDAYRRLSIRKFNSTGSAITLVRAFRHLLNKYNIEVDNPQCSSGESSSKQEPEASDDAAEAKQVSVSTDKQDSQEETGEDGSGIGDSEAEADEEDEGDGSGDGNSEGEDETDDDVGNSSEDSVGGGKKSLQERINEIKIQVKEDEEVRDQVSRINESIRASTTSIHDLNRLKGMVEVSVSASLKNTSVLVMGEFRKLYAELEGGWKYGSDDGLINIDRAMMPESDPDEIYDQWDEGTQTDVGIEMIVFLDTSMSMNGPKIESAEQSTWVLKRALDEIEAKVTVISFDEDTGMIYWPEEKAKQHTLYHMSELGGDTQPAEGMQISRRRLKDSSAPNKIFVVVTDGVWSGKSDLKVDPIETSLQNMPGKNVYIGINQKCSSRFDKYFHINKVISDPADILSIVRELVTQILREAKR